MRLEGAIPEGERTPFGFSSTPETEAAVVMINVVDGKTRTPHGCDVPR